MNTIKPAKLKMIVALFNEGLSNRDICRRTNISKLTAAVLREKHAPDAKCPCGQLGNHRGFCSVRFARSPERQAFIAAWNPKAPNPSGLCQCGCGGMTSKAEYDEPASSLGAGQHHRFIQGHWHKAVRKYEKTWGQHSQRIRAAEERMMKGEFWIALHAMWADQEESAKERAIWLQFACEIHREQRAFRITRDLEIARQEKVHRQAVREHKMHAVWGERQARWTFLTAVEMERVRRRIEKREGIRRSTLLTKNTTHVFKHLAAATLITQ